MQTLSPRPACCRTHKGIQRAIQPRLPYPRPPAATAAADLPRLLLLLFLTSRCCYSCCCCCRRVHATTVSRDLLPMQTCPRFVNDTAAAASDFSHIRSLDHYHTVVECAHLVRVFPDHTAWVAGCTRPGLPCDFTRKCADMSLILTATSPTTISLSGVRR